MQARKVDIFSEDYRTLNAVLHLKFPSYGASGHKWADLVKSFGMTDILDFGCGKGTLAKALDFPIREFDPFIPGKNEAPEPADLVVCTDVLEHIEPDYLDNVLSAIHWLTKKKAFFVVATREAQKKLPDGRNAHLIVQPAQWWGEKLSRYFKIERFEENVTEEADFAMLVSKKET